MNFTQDATVRTATGDDVGRVDRVVMDPRTNEVTHIVVRKGLLFTVDKVVPVNMIASSSDEAVLLRRDADDLQKLPDYQETYYVPADELTPGEADAERAETHARYAVPVYPYPPFGMGYPGYSHGLGYGAAMQPNLVAQTTTNIPQNEVALKNGANVMSRDDQHVGDVAQVLTDPSTNQATHFVISQGLLFKSRKLIPVDWVKSVDEDEVQLSVTAKTLERTKDYE